MVAGFGWMEDFHLHSVDRARHIEKAPRGAGPSSRTKADAAGGRCPIATLSQASSAVHRRSHRPPCACTQQPADYSEAAARNAGGRCAFAFSAATHGDLHTGSHRYHGDQTGSGAPIIALASGGIVRGLPVHSSCTAIGFDRLVGFVHSPLLNQERLVCRTVRPRQTCVMRYTGWFYENGAKGKKFELDSSVHRAQPFEFSIGRRQVSPAGTKASLSWRSAASARRSFRQRWAMAPAAPAASSRERDADLRCRIARREGLRSRRARRPVRAACRASGLKRQLPALQKANCKRRACDTSLQNTSCKTKSGGNAS
jgi:hypothetical protein